MFLGVRSQGSGVRGQESGVRSQESGVRSQGSGVRGQVINHSENIIKKTNKLFIINALQTTNLFFPDS
jgi:hypothetical protein